MAKKTYITNCAVVIAMKPGVAATATKKATPPETKEFAKGTRVQLTDEQLESLPKGAVSVAPAAEEEAPAKKAPAKKAPAKKAAAKESAPEETDADEGEGDGTELV